MISPSARWYGSSTSSKSSTAAICRDHLHPRHVLLSLDALRSSYAIHPSAWKVCSRKLLSRILHRTDSVGSPSRLSLILAPVTRPLHLGAVDRYAQCCIRAPNSECSQGELAQPARPRGSQLQATLLALSRLTRDRNR